MIVDYLIGLSIRILYLFLNSYLLKFALFEIISFFNKSKKEINVLSVSLSITLWVYIMHLICNMKF